MDEHDNKETGVMNPSEAASLSPTQAMLKEAFDRFYGRFGNELTASRHGQESLEEFRKKRRVGTPGILMENVCVNMPCLYDELNILYDCVEALFQDNRVEAVWEMPAFLRCKEDAVPEVYAGLCLLSSDMEDWMEDAKNYGVLIPLMSKKMSLESSRLMRRVAAQKRRKLDDVRKLGEYFNSSTKHQREDSVVRFVDVFYGLMVRMELFKLSVDRLVELSRKSEPQILECAIEVERMKLLLLQLATEVCRAKPVVTEFFYEVLPLIPKRRRRRLV